MANRVNGSYYARAMFLKSAAKAGQAPADQGFEIAFAGRSNAGKSSAINVLCGIKRLARTSKTPGRTQLLNFFALDEQRRLVDLPGYGFAKVPLAVKGQWESMITGYLADRVSLQGMFLIADIRREITDYDRQLLEWAGQRALPVHILLTKSDKISRGAAQGALQKVRAALQREGRERVSCQVFSSLNRVGVEPAWQRMNELLDLPPAG